MDFELTDDQAALQEGVRTLCQGAFSFDTVRAAEEHGGRIDRAGWGELAGIGMFSLLSDGFGVSDAVLAFEELGAALVPGPIVETMLAATHLPSIAAGDGSTTVGVTWPSELVVAVEHASDLDVLLVVDDTGIHRVELGSLALEEAERPLDPLTPVSYLRGALPAGETVAGPEVAARFVCEATVLTAALQLGISLGATNLAVQYAKEREQFGRAIGTFQAVKHMAADMLTKAEVARAAVYAAACALDDKSDTDPAFAASVAKIVAGEAALFAGKTGIQIHGGMGFTWEVHAQAYWKRACVLDTHYGNIDHHSEQIALASSR